MQFALATQFAAHRSHPAHSPEKDTGRSTWPVASMAFRISALHSSIFEPASSQGSAEEQPRSAPPNWRASINPSSARQRRIVASSRMATKYRRDVPFPPKGTRVQGLACQAEDFAARRSVTFARRQRARQPASRLSAEAGRSRPRPAQRAFQPIRGMPHTGASSVRSHRHAHVAASAGTSGRATSPNAALRAAGGGRRGDGRLERDCCRDRCPREISR